MFSKKITGLSLFVFILSASLLVTSCSKMGMTGNSDNMSKSESMDIVETAVSAGSFNTLATALTEAGLVDTLKGPGPFTVFAPTDEAFSKLPEGTLESLLQPENKDKLVSILTYHVVPGKVTASEVVNLHSAETVNGKKLSITTRNGTVMVDGVCQVIKTDRVGSDAPFFGIFVYLDNLVSWIFGR